MSKIDEVRDYIKGSFEENIKLNNWISTQEKVNDDKIGDICKDFLQVLESFEWAEASIHERELDKSKISTGAITRLLTAKTKLLEVLQTYGVKMVTFPEGKIGSNTSMVKVVSTVTDPEKADDTVVKVVKDGFYRKNRLLRQAEVIVVKN
jgi:molecular chaperone GrpE (heat shock protein)